MHSEFINNIFIKLNPKGAFFAFIKVVEKGPETINSAWSKLEEMIYKTINHGCHGDSRHLIFADFQNVSSLLIFIQIV